MCRRCQRVHHVQSNNIPKQCSCGQQFQNHSENATITDVIYNIIVGSLKEKGYLIVDANPKYGGMVWWTPASRDEDIGETFIGDMARIRETDIYTGQGIESRDDLRPVHTTTTSRRFFRK